MSDHPVAKGNRTEARILAALLERYDTVLLPYGGNCRYDLAIDDGGHLLRVQCKTGRIRGSRLVFTTCSSLAHRKPGTHPAYHGQADFFGVWCPATKTAYLVPVADVGDTLGTLRIDPTKNNQVAGIRWAKDYELTGAKLPLKGSNLIPSAPDADALPDELRGTNCRGSLLPPE
jgi:PD-(D/E)XK endonuclease